MKVIHLLVDGEDDADVWHHVTHGRGEALVEASVPLDSAARQMATVKHTLIHNATTSAGRREMALRRRTFQPDQRTTSEPHRVAKATDSN